MIESVGTRMFNNGIGSDIIVKCNGVELKLHTFVLLEYSGYFKAAINFGCGSYLDMDIEDTAIDIRLVPQVLRRIYTGEQYVFDTMVKHIEISKVYRYLIIDFDADIAVMNGVIRDTLKGDGYVRAISFGKSPIRYQSMAKAVSYINYLLGTTLILGYEYQRPNGTVLKLDNKSVKSIMIPYHGLEFKALKDLVE